jgi:hypothetical protein
LCLDKKKFIFTKVFEISKFKIKTELKVFIEANKKLKRDQQKSVKNGKFIIYHKKIFENGKYLKVSLLNFSQKGFYLTWM